MDKPSLVSVTSVPQRKGAGGQVDDPAQLIREGSFKLGSLSVHYTRIAAHLIGISSAVCRRQARELRGALGTAESVTRTSGRAADLPDSESGMRKLLNDEEAQCVSPEIMARMATVLRGADAVIAGPLSAADHSTPGLLPHLADLAGNAFRALRPPRPLIGHNGFGQVARKFPYIQMNRDDARRMAAGAMDLGVLARALRRLQGDGGEFAITSFGGHGVLWADGVEWEIEPIAGNDIDDVFASDVFCVAWITARQFQRASVSDALARARNAAAKALAARQV